MYICDNLFSLKKIYNMIGDCNKMKGNFIDFSNKVYVY